jgi:uncharacterized membrane protein/uncharacterized RDD family membrane protein YckC
LVDELLLSSDILGTALFFALPGLLWLFLYAWAWDSGPTARAAGFGRGVFWLLLPAALAGSLSNAPFFSWERSVLAINIGGAAIPIFLAVYLPVRWLGANGRSTLLRALEWFTVLALALFAVLVWPNGPAASGIGTILLPVAITVGLLVVAAFAPEPGAPRGGLGRSIARPAFGFLLLGVSALLVTYFTTQAVPGVGIISIFPFYLIAPVAVGVAAVLLARPLMGLSPLAGVPFGYSAATFGVLVGADVLHQPPLYGHGAGILSVGGAGLLDLVYLSGLLAASGAFLTYAVLTRRGSVQPLPLRLTGAVATPTPQGLLREAVRRRAAGNFGGCVARSREAADAALAELRELRSLPAAAGGPDLWSGLEVPSWVNTDHQNLGALARLGPSVEPREAERALLAAQLLVHIATELERRDFGGVWTRVGAFLIDLTVVTAPAVVVWGLLALALPGDSDTILLGTPYNTALFAYPAFAFLYFLLSEWWGGTTLGKRILGLEVRTRALARPKMVALLTRNAPRLVPLTILAELVGAALVLLLHPGPATLNGRTISLAGLDAVLLVLVAVFALLIAGGVSVAVMLLTPDRARLGDVWAGTWVLNRRAPPAPPGSMLPDSARAAGRSG